jgi:hypothetical protein
MLKKNYYDEFHKSSHYTIQEADGRFSLFRQFNGELKTLVESFGSKEEVQQAMKSAVEQTNFPEINEESGLHPASLSVMFEAVQRIPITRSESIVINGMKAENPNGWTLGDIIEFAAYQFPEEDGLPLGLSYRERLVLERFNQPIPDHFEVDFSS